MKEHGAISQDGWSATAPSPGSLPESLPATSAMPGLAPGVAPGSAADAGIDNVAKGHRDRVRLALAVTLGGLCYAFYVLYLYEVRPVWYALFICEDNAAEYGTAMSFLAAAAVSLWAAVFAKGKARRVGSLVLALGLFALGMEEISWGQRILGLETPEALRGVNLQEEITLHNLADPNLVQAAMVVMILGWLIASAAAALRQGLWRKLDAWGLPMAGWTTAGLFLVVVGMLLWEPRMNYQEATEFLLGLAVLTWALARAVRHAEGESPRWWVTISAVALVVVFVAGSTYVLTIKRPGWNGWIMNRLATEGYAHAGNHAGALQLFNHMQANPKLMMPHTRMAHAASSQALGYHDQSLNILFQALPYYERKLSQEASALNLRNLGRCHQLLGEAAVAQRYFDQARALDEATIARTTDVNEKAQAMWSLARTQQWDADVTTALETSGQAKALTTSPTLKLYIQRWEDRHARTGLPWTER